VKAKIFKNWNVSFLEGSELSRYKPKFPFSVRYPSPLSVSVCMLACVCACVCRERQRGGGGREHTHTHPG